ncbi:tartrate-resistant acid phosphatase type 5-like [Uloborus diversus]|uniref:tartrate-resistant acid phosphatase type 5-like n=1 Tax=Uloborus diversus TaxID=327109 RepID=UPI00240A32A3|nr:tartrate-resistant acid phosphatase type 5-like [Uloborus diversus]
MLTSLTTVFFLFIDLKCATATGSSLKFLVIGDWGGLPIFPYRTLVELNVGREMAEAATKLGIDFVLTLGDNFYFDGVKDVDDPRFKETYESAFNYESLQIPWFIIAGNHDHYGNVSAQIAYSARSDRWIFPDLYYRKKFQVPSSNATVEIIMLDTVMLCGNTDPLNPYEPPAFRKYTKYQEEKQWQWLEESLKLSKAEYLIVCGHFPVYSVALHGSTDCLVKRLKPLLEKYHVSAYFSGHDHNLQHIQVKTNSTVMDYFVSGSANFIDPSKRHFKEIPPNSLLFHWGNPYSLGAFTFMDISAKNMTVAFVHSVGKFLYSYSREPRQFR